MKLTERNKSGALFIDLVRMKKNGNKEFQPITRTAADDDKTKLKFEAKKIRWDESKATVSLKSQSQNSIADQLLTKSALISEEASKNQEDSFNSVEEIDPLFIKGVVSNHRPID